jgi:hypothetical protein
MRILLSALPQVCGVGRSGRSGAWVPSPLWGELGWGFVPYTEAKREESSFSEEKEAKRLLFLRLRRDGAFGSTV